MIKAEAKTVDGKQEVDFSSGGSSHEIAYELAAILATGLHRLEPRVKTSMKRFSKHIAKMAYDAYKQQKWESKNEK